MLTYVMCVRKNNKRVSKRVVIYRAEEKFRCESNNKGNWGNS